MIREVMEYDIVLINGVKTKLNRGQVCNIVYPNERWCELHKVEDVPMTRMFLEVNGFEDRGEYGFQRLPDEACQRHLTLFLKDGIFANGKPYEDDCIDYIHEVFSVRDFQHSLRVCGLSEFANNLKLI